jgi:Ca2+/Na+ antiporter
MSKKPIHFLEVVWIIVGLACIFFGIQKAIETNLNNSFTFFILAAVSFLMFTLRRHLRRKDNTD